MQETWVQSLGQEDPLEEEIATYSSNLACEIPWTEEPGRLQSMRSQRVGYAQAHMPKHQYGKQRQQVQLLQLPVSKFIKGTSLIFSLFSKLPPMGYLL